VILVKVALTTLATWLAACSTVPPPPSTPSLAPSASPVTSIAVPLGSTSPSTAVSVSPADRWGPLAVVRPQDGADTARTEGKLRISDACVTLDSRSGTTLLYWPSDRTTWNAAASTITFTNYDGSLVTVRDGDAVVLGGSGDDGTESGTSGQTWVERTVWVARPSPSCPLDQRWAVGAVEP
jgi:hypothetical protein